MTIHSPALDRLTREVNGGLEKCFDRLRSDSILDDGSPSAVETMHRFVFSGGKRFRPLLFLLSYRGYTESPNPDAIHIAVALELLHNFALIHDDLVDEATARRGQPALHAWFDSQQTPTRDRGTSVGRSLALLVGDVLFAAALDAFRTASFSPEKNDTALAYLLSTSMQTGAGAYQEVALRDKPLHQIQRQTVLTIYRRKTVQYTFTCPLLLAGILADVPDDENEKLKQLADHLGIAYQIRDDIRDLDAFLHSPTMSEGVQFCETKLMLPLIHAYEQATKNEQAWISDVYQNRRLLPDERERLRAIIARTNAYELADLKAKELCNQATDICSDLRISPSSRETLLTELIPRLRPHGNLQGATP